MNFIAHYHFYKSDDCYYNLGLVLPDLVKSFCKTHLKPSEPLVHPSLNNLNQGSIVHLNADKLFHNSFYFTTCEKHLSEIADTKAQWPRKWFLNHLLCEILLDRIIIDQYPNIVEQFYKDLKSVNTEQVALYLKKQVSIILKTSMKVWIDLSALSLFLTIYTMKKSFWR